MKNTKNNHFDNISSLEKWIAPHRLTDKMRSWLADYWQGKKMRAPRASWFDLSEGTPFQISVWETLLTIPYGEVRSYQWIGTQLGKRGGSQAVGQANKKNPYPILIPCHRIIRANGNLGGYAYGQEMKKQLLQHEGFCI